MQHGVVGRSGPGRLVALRKVAVATPNRFHCSWLNTQSARGTRDIPPSVNNLTCVGAFFVIPEMLMSVQRPSYQRRHILLACL